jgi:hypothetical protein
MNDINQVRAAANPNPSSNPAVAPNNRNDTSSSSGNSSSNKNSISPNPNPNPNHSTNSSNKSDSSSNPKSKSNLPSTRELDDLFSQLDPEYSGPGKGPNGRNHVEDDSMTELLKLSKILIAGEEDRGG